MPRRPKELLNSSNYRHKVKTIFRILELLDFPIESAKECTSIPTQELPNKAMIETFSCHLPNS